MLRPMATHKGWNAGTEWLVDAFDCDPVRLSSLEIVGPVFDRVIVELALKPVSAPAFHVFPGAGGLTGFAMLSESHLSCHTFPETGFAAFDLFCCRPRPEWDWEGELGKILGARRVVVRRFSRGVAEQ
jgi:S-adenosylmethionine decarboxylase